ncbi:hypothetical protein J5I95_08785 [Candidatus Poribacteria bacterium]|nr:hypothetical protein [Candidatus Poribacteria bacterium]
MYKKFFVIGLTCLINLSIMVNTGYTQERITGPWLWMIALTELNEGGQASTDIDSLDEASKGRTNEEQIAKNGAKEGDTVSGYKWTPGELPADGNINSMLVDIGMTEIADFNDVTSYAIIIIESDREQGNVAMGVSSDDSVKVWLNGEVVHKNAINRGRGGPNEFQDEFQVNLKEGANLLMVKVSERGGGWGMNVGLDADFEHSLNFDDYEHVKFDAKGDPIPVVESEWGANRRITGPWLWMIAPTDANQGGQASTDVDSLDEASRGKITEEDVAKNGARAGDVVGDYKWTLGTLPANGDINAAVVSIGMTNVADFNDVTSYALITLKTIKAQRDVTMGVNSDDSIKVWLNGEVVHTNAVNRGRGNANTFQDTFEVDLKRGNNLLMVKVSERGGGWGMYVGIDADFALSRTPGRLSVEPAGKFITQWGELKRAR